MGQKHSEILYNLVDFKNKAAFRYGKVNERREEIHDPKKI